MHDIRLIQPHTHAGRDYPPDAVLTVDAATADWLLARRIGVPAPPDVVGAVKGARRATKHPAPRIADPDTTGDETP